MASDASHAGREPTWLRPAWQLPPGVHAAFSLRGGGRSQAPFDALNLALHVGDDSQAVQQNRQALAAALGLPAAPAWLEQVHGTRVVDLDADAPAGPADAAVTRQPGRVLAILVADCLPVLMVGDEGRVLAAAHAGWRGLAGGVLEATLAALRVPPGGVQCWLGPCIGPAHFEVGAEVRDAFLARDAAATSAFVPNARGRWQCDLAALARQRLAAAGVPAVASADLCTYADAQRCYSFRRDGRTGRMAALLWRT